jgi:peptidylprolyl isomerase
MKVFVPIVGLCLALALASCGEESSRTAAKPEPETTQQASSEPAQAPSDTAESNLPTNSKAARKRAEPKVQVPSGPPPKDVVVTDLVKGSGVPLEGEVLFEANYVTYDYKTGKKLESTWDQGEPSLFSFDREEIREGWERGLKGMRVGGRRELIVPSELAYGNGPLVYVLDLLRIE